MLFLLLQNNMKVFIKPMKYAEKFSSQFIFVDFVINFQVKMNFHPRKIFYLFQVILTLVGAHSIGYKFCKRILFF